MQVAFFNEITKKLFALNLRNSLHQNFTALINFVEFDISSLKGKAVYLRK